MDFFLQLVFAGICVGSAYALIAMGLSLTFWSTKTMNFGQGSLLMLGAVACATLMGLGVHPGLSVMLAIMVSGVLMVVAERLAIRPLLKSGDSMGWVVSTLGFGLLVQGLVAKFFGSQAIAVPTLLFDSTSFVVLAGIQVSSQSLSVLVVSLVLMIGMECFLRYSAWGRAIRAVAHDTDAASLVGVPVRYVILLSFVFSGCLAGFAGILLAQINGTIDPAFGFNLMVLGFVAAVLGGMGSILGATLGGMVLGVIQKLVGGYVSSAFENAMAFSILMLILTTRPHGLFGRPEVNKV